MFPVIPAVVIALISFFASAFILLRILLPVLPPSPLSRKVAPSEFGLPNFKSLSLVDKCHIWLASLDIVAIALLVWQAVSDSMASSNGALTSTDPLSAVRIWFITTARPTFLLVLLAITLLHVRLGRPVSFGTGQWMVSSPTVVIVVASTALAGVLAATGLGTFPIGLLAYSSIIATLSSVCLLCLVYTLMNIKRNLRTDHHHVHDEAWPPVRHMEEEKPRPSFTTEEIDALRDGGASWITSEPGSRRASISEWSFTTAKTNQASHHGGRPQSATHPSIPAKSSFWFKSSSPDPSSVPPVPPLPSAYGGPISPSSEDLRDGDPFRREVPSMSQEQLGHDPRWRLGSQASWLTSTDGTHPTVSAWSWSTRNESHLNVGTQLLTSTAVSRPVTPAMADAQVLGGYGYAPESGMTGSSETMHPSDATVNVSTTRSLLWLVSLALPLGFAAPYLVSIHSKSAVPAPISILFSLAVALPSPLLALNIVLRSPLPVPLGLFDTTSELPRPITPSTVVGKFSHEYKRSMSTSVTVVEGRRSGDVWLTNGDAVDGKGKFGRAVEMLHPKPKLSVLPPEVEDGELTPPLPIQDESSLPLSVHNTPRSETSAQWGRLRKDSKASSHISGVDEGTAHAARIMVAQRHYSTLAQTFKVSSSPDKPNTVNLETATASGSEVEVARRSSAHMHLRSRSVSSVAGPMTPTTMSSFSRLESHVSPSPPPSFPLPPTPPNVRAARLSALKHKKSFSSGYSFGPVDNVNEIDALTAGVLPLLVPGLTVGDEMVIKNYSPPTKYRKTQGKKAERLRKLHEFGGDFSSPEFHSTPARARQPRSRKNSAFKHFSLPSLGLGKDGVHSLATWTAEVGRAIEMKAGQIISTPRNVELSHRNTVFGAESIPNLPPRLETLEETRGPAPGVSRTFSTRGLGLRAEVPHGVATARSSLISMPPIPASAASSNTFVDFEADSGPQAESTPHNVVVAKKRGGSRGTENTGRSSIVYIKSSDPPTSAPITPSGSRPRLVPKAKKTSVPRTPSTDDSQSPSPPSGGLRPLSLLRNLDTNVDSSGSMSSGERKLIDLGKTKKGSLRSSKGENVQPKNRNFKQLTLARSETSKLRGLLRKDEVLPNVVVRPPSHSDQNAFAYSFQP